MRRRLATVDFMSLLLEAIIFLSAALVMVPISKRFGFGSVLGYLAGGIIIGPSVLNLVTDPQHILHFAELGVVFLLFIIGLELQPSRLWVLRRMVFGLGAAQVLLSAAIISAVALAFGTSGKTAVVIGLILALSSTAFVLQLLAEKKQLTTTYGRAAFAILLFQDLAVIPLIALLPLLGSSGAGEFSITEFAFVFGAIAALILGGRYLLRPVLKVAANTDIPEIFTSTALFVVIGAALLMELAGLSMVLGAFIAGMLLADSEFRHQLEADIAPFKGLLLGLFFIAVGMTVNLDLLMEQPGTIAIMVISLMLAKALVILPLARAFGIRDLAAARTVAIVLAQGGEFAFVLFAIAIREQLIDRSLFDQLILAVVVSMLLTPITYLVNEKFSAAKKDVAPPAFDEMESEYNEVIIAGFGRMGQIVGRLLSSVGRPFTALEADTRQVDVVRRYGNKVYYGDAAKLELLRAAGAAHAKVFVLAIPDMEESMKIAATVRRHFPNLTIVARARNRRHEYHLMDLGIEHIFRETLSSSLELTEQVLFDLGFEDREVLKIVQAFREHDARLIREQHAVHHDEEQLIQTTRETARELELLLRNDLKK